MRLITALDKFRENVSAETVLVRRRRWKMIDTGGAGPVLLMLPGTLGNADIFFKQIGTLGGHLRIIALAYALIDDVDLLAGDINRLLQRLAIPRASILEHFRAILGHLTVHQGPVGRRGLPVDVGHRPKTATPPRGLGGRPSVATLSHSDALRR